MLLVLGGFGLPKFTNCYCVPLTILIWKSDILNSSHPYSLSYIEWQETMSVQRELERLIYNWNFKKDLCILSVLSYYTMFYFMLFTGFPLLLRASSPMQLPHQLAWVDRFHQLLPVLPATQVDNCHCGWWYGVWQEGFQVIV